MNPRTRAVGHNLVVCKGFAGSGALTLFPVGAKGTLLHQGRFALGWKWPISHLVGWLPTLGARMGEAQHLSAKVLKSGLAGTVQNGHWPRRVPSSGKVSVHSLWVPLDWQEALRVSRV